MIKFWVSDEGENHYIGIERIKADDRKIQNKATATNELFQNFYVIFEISEEVVEEIKSVKKELTAKEKFAHVRASHCQECGWRLKETATGFEKCPKCGA